MTGSESNLWCVRCAQRLSVRRWEDEIVVYDDRSGDTHIFEELAGRVLERLLSASANNEELASLVADFEGKDVPDDGCFAQVVDVLERLCGTGIVKPAQT